MPAALCHILGKAGRKFVPLSTRLSLLPSATSAVSWKSMSDIPHPENSRVLITFDVDGTLIHSVGPLANKLHKDAFSYAFKHVFGVTGTIDAIHHHGSTDPLVCINTLAHYGIPKKESESRVDELKSKMLEYVHLHKDKVVEGLELLPGVLSLLQTLSNHPRAVVGLVTGNLEDIGWLKMNGLGILPYFSVPNIGGFGSDHTDRGELVKIAAQRAAERIPGPPFSLRVHVGDTPNDILAAQYGGALAVGVSTGVFSEADLKAADSEGTAVFLPDLADNSLFLKAAQLDG